MRPVSEASLAVTAGIPAIAVVIAALLILLVARSRPELTTRYAMAVALIAGAEFLLATWDYLSEPIYSRPLFC